MSKHARRLLALAIATLTAVAVSACGSSSDDDGGTGTGAPVKGKKGGMLKAVFAGDFEHIDPGEAFYQPDYMMIYAAHRPLYSFEPTKLDVASPDLAAQQPRLSDGGRTVTVKLKPGVKFSPPVNRAATSEDVKYAIERAFTAAVPNGYAPTYFGVIEGAPEPGQKKPTDITGIETPDDQTIVFKLSEPSGAFIKALSLPITAPVPEAYAKRYDSRTPSRYGNYQVATGPYMIEAGKDGKITYEVGKSMTLVRNPNWTAASDFRPGYVDRIEFSMGNEDATVAARQILNGKGMINGDFSPDPPVIKQAVQRRKSQITFAPLGNRYIGLNTKVKPLDDVNVRKAIIAASDRNALRLTRGGPIVGDLATHFLAPGQPGFEEAGGMKGPNLDFVENPDGNRALAAEYMKKAGYESGRYAGSETLTMVGDDSGIGAKTAEVFQSQLQKLGFKVDFRQVPHETMYSEFCNVPKARVAVCPNVGWLPDFADGQAWFDPTFNGEAIVPENNSNWPQLDVPAINKAIDEAKKITDQTKRDKAWATIDRMVMAQAPAVPWIWDKQANVASSDVQGVTARWNAQWDLAYTSIK
ncbi:MAG: ABC transporter substrate-binding protein [Solirubrobacteraceae bacterium]